MMRTAKPIGTEQTSDTFCIPDAEISVCFTLFFKDFGILLCSSYELQRVEPDNEILSFICIATGLVLQTDAYIYAYSALVVLRS